MTAAPPRPRPARFAQGEHVLAEGERAVVSVVFPADPNGRRLYSVEWEAGPDAGWSGVVDEAALAPAPAVAS